MSRGGARSTTTTVLSSSVQQPCFFSGRSSSICSLFSMASELRPAPLSFPSPFCPAGLLHSTSTSQDVDFLLGLPRIFWIVLADIACLAVFFFVTRQVHEIEKRGRVTR
ncbi:unnamed protein product [Prorocentrum cordatum]|uniref:Uncharacterized protein n=1 Tax=Prorocentrum cordatum TaxID=2364126 RepID=A0ABN9RVU6_9DINO|nr:unnamed protein product [Polarella glacialis]